MTIKKISSELYEDFVNRSSLASFYQSKEWLEEKKLEGKDGELVGLYKEDKLIGVSLILYLQVLKKYKFAYASRGFIYDYQDINDFKKALQDYFQDVVFIRIDPPIILAKYDHDLKRVEDTQSLQIINDLKKHGFLHFGFNMGAETMQFRFIHRLVLKDSFDAQMTEMSKSTRKNMEIAESKGVKVKTVDITEVDEVMRLFNKTIERKKIKGFSKTFYKNLCEVYQDNVKMYIIYIDKAEYLNNLDQKIKNAKDKLAMVEKKMTHDNIGNKLKTAVEQAKQAIQKYQTELTKAKNLADYTNIGAMLTITKYNEVVSLTSGMDNDYREFCPKYVMYPAMIKDAIDKHLTYVNFLGVKDILNPHNPDYGVYEVKRGFGGETIEYIGEFDLPIKPVLYKMYQIKRKIK